MPPPFRRGGSVGPGWSWERDCAELPGGGIPAGIDLRGNRRVVRRSADRSGVRSRAGSSETASPRADSAAISSVLPPPISATTMVPEVSPVAPRPRKVNAASSSPEITRRSQPVSFRALVRKPRHWLPRAWPRSRRRRAGSRRARGRSRRSGRAFDGGVDPVLRQHPGRLETGAEANRFRFLGQNLELAAPQPGDGHLDRIGADIDRGHGSGWFLCVLDFAGHGRRSCDQRML